MKKLTNVQGYAIRGMLNEGKSAEVIAKTIGSPLNVVDAYIAGLTAALGRLEENGIVFSEPKAEDVETSQPEEKVEDEFGEVSLDKKNMPTEDKNRIVRTVAAKGLGKELLIHKSDGGAAGPTIMTPGASALSDEMRKFDKPVVSRTAKGNLYDTKGNKKGDE